MKESRVKELGTERIGRLLLKYAMPAIVGMVAASVMNLADSYFIGNYVGKNALSGMTVTLPFMNLAAAFGVMIGVGAGSVISIRLGQRNVQTANHVLGNAATLSLIIGLLVSLIGLVWMDSFLHWFGASPNTAPYAKEYMQVLLFGNVFSHSFHGLNNVLRAGGHPRRAMQCTLLAVGLNFLLTPLFVVQFGWGIRGAAWATVLSQSVALAWQLRTLAHGFEVLHFTRGTYRLRLPVVRQILSIGASPFLTTACSCLLVLIINQSMRRWGDTLPIENGGDAAIAAYGIDNRVVHLFVMIAIGLNQGMQPIVGYNWGIGQKERVRKTLKLTILAASCVTSIGFLVGECFPNQVVHIFVQNAPEVTTLAAHGFRINVAMFPIVGAQMVIANFFRSIGHAATSLFLTLTRQLIFFIPALFILPCWIGFDGIWWSIPTSDLFSFLVALAMLLRMRKRLVSASATFF